MIPTRTLGPNGPTLSALGFGCMGMSEFYGPSDDVESRRVLEAAVEAGIQLFDTADTYGLGHNERLLAPLIAAHGERICVATKFGIAREPGQYARSINNQPDYIRRACDASRQRLGVDTIDLYYCHRRDPAVPIETLMETLAALVAEGKVRAIGLSEVSADTLRRAAAIHPVTAVQSEYSLWSREPERDLLDACHELGTTLVAYSPLGRGFLTGALGSTDALADDDFRRRSPRFTEDAMAHNQRLVDALAAFATVRDATPAQIALAWLINKHPNVVPIPGTRKISRLHENLTGAALTFNTAEIAELDTLFDPAAVAGERYPAAGWTGIERT
ncbi:aldo/keto reductase [Denitromonas ohlonensis]|jgi:aryl-alcohol dehydrogenase-like predicted oxidoreductase|uniref:aldo/keto reductase n=1 Tax=Denitromonas ohlonensis TaxID=3078508 RepID=UPI001C9250C1|nr:aldo/keto reductase [Denitromonas ohlonensis]